MTRDELPPAPPIYLGAALEQRYYDLARESPLDRGGFHVSDAVGDRGWRCDRYVQLVLQGAQRNPTKDREFRLKRYELGDAFHQWVYRNARSALILKALGMGMEILQVSMENPLVDDETGMIGTPDLVLFYRAPGSRITKSVHDIKSLTPSALSRMQGKRGINPLKRSLRQLLSYCEMTGADYGSFCYILTEPPYQHIDHHIDPSGRILRDIRARVARLRENLETGRWPGLIEAGSYCTDCPLRDECRKIGPRAIEGRSRGGQE